MPLLANLPSLSRFLFGIEFTPFYGPARMRSERPDPVTVASERRTEAKKGWRVES
jgi:hypothetical protein